MSLLRVVEMEALLYGIDVANVIKKPMKLILLIQIQVCKLENYDRLSYMDL